MKNKIVAIIEARMSSTRLEGKVLKKIDGEEVLKIIIKRLRFSKQINQIIVATTKAKKDDRIARFLKKNKQLYYRGSSSDVMGRIINAAEKFKAEIIVRVTGDNPLTDPNIIDYMLIQK